MRVNIKGLDSCYKRLADGRVKVYWYAWRGGPRLDGEPGSLEFMASYNKAVATRPDLGDNLKNLIREYQAGHRFLKLSPRSKSDYRKLLDKIEAKFGDMPLAATAAKETRGILRRWRDELAKASERQADYAWSVLSAVFSHGIEYGHITVNPCALGGKLYGGSRIDTIWSTVQVAAFLSVRQYAHLHLPLLIGLWTGQREGDVLRIRWSDYDGEVLRLRQRKVFSRRGRRKGAAAVVIPVAEPLKAALDAARAARLKAKVTPLKLADETICLNSEGEPWTEGKAGYNGFISSFKKARKLAGLEGVSFSDLRGTAVTRLALAGCTVPEICAITGHSHAEANAILEAHYLHRDPAIAWNAIRKLEALVGTAESNSAVPEEGTVAEQKTSRGGEILRTASRTGLVVPLKRTKKIK